MEIHMSNFFFNSWFFWFFYKKLRASHIKKNTIPQNVNTYKQTKIQMADTRFGLATTATTKKRKNKIEK